MKRMMKMKMLIVMISISMTSNNKLSKKSLLMGIFQVLDMVMGVQLSKIICTYLVAGTEN